MYHLFETIRVVNSAIQYLPYHQERVDRAFKQFYEGTKSLNLERSIRQLPEYSRGILKCKVLYNATEHTVELSPYQPRKVHSLKLVNAGNLEYEFKLYDRTGIDNLFLLRESCDDILIVKNGKITDTSIANIIFSDGSNWYTPDAPLMEGTARSRLILMGVITQKEITLTNYRQFSSFMVINAMQDFNVNRSLAIDKILG